MKNLHKRTNQIFICYRREDSSWVAGRIYDRLVQKYSNEAIFKDINSIPLGTIFKDHIISVISQCSVFLVVISDRWMGENVELGKRRIDDPTDIMRMEIEVALQLDIPVIPLLVQHTSMPVKENLPLALNGLADRHGMRISNDPYFHVDMDRLVEHLLLFFPEFTKNDIKSFDNLAKAAIYLVILLLVILLGAVFKID